MTTPSFAYLFSSYHVDSQSVLSNFNKIFISGAFLIPFTIMLIIAGLPLMFMELSFGQYAALGPVAVYRRFCPLMRGLGYGMIIVSAIVMLYYNLIIAWTIFYMYASFTSELPWQNCEKEWSTAREYHLSVCHVIHKSKLL